MKTLRLILGDQLNAGHSWFKETHPDITYAMMEIRQETDYVMHHAQKILAFFAAMRAFAEDLRGKGHTVVYYRINDPANTQSLTGNLNKLLTEGSFETVEYQEPDEYRLDKQLADWAISQKVAVRCVSSEHFLTTRQDFSKIFSDSKEYVMERFYRHMRRRLRVMVDEVGRPWGGRWNFDQENRKFFKGNEPVPPPWYSRQDLAETWKDIEKCGCRWFGKIQTRHLPFAITRAEALDCLEHFMQWGLLRFGMYQDSMNADYPFLWHSRLSFALNVKLLHPLEVINRALEAYQKDPEKYNLAQVEGFIRQIIGWREYMRGIYWTHMPEFGQLNFFNHHRPLPSWFWNGNTRMRCMRLCIQTSLDHAYAHHIQRLMITGAFCLLAGIHPDDVDRWYLGIYADAIEWVQITNTRGMSQYADGGITATKPYVGSAAYISRMSDYCRGCFYDPKEKFGPRACPFNALYWNFFIINNHKLRNNPRLSIVYKQIDSFPKDLKEKILQKSADILESIETL
jgi:deoxyribodipyrimidine photolyase-related protein